MKKLFLTVAALSGLLASCGSVIVEPPVYGPVTLTKLNSYTSSQQVNINGQIQDAVCINRDTTLSMDTSWSGPLSQMFARFTYRPTSGTATTKTVSTPKTAPNYSGRDTFTYTIGANVLSSASLSGITVGGATGKVSAQAIIVNPVQIGTVGVELQGVNPNGVNSNVIETVQYLPVVQCP